MAAKMCGGVRYVCERVRRRLWGSLAEQWPLAPCGHAPLRSQCHLVFRFISFFTKSSARPASRIVDIVTVFLAALAVLIVNISFSPKTKWHCDRSGACPQGASGHCSARLPHYLLLTCSHT
jgi:hypothetical protein